MEESSQSLPPLEWVRAFEATARLGSFTAAANEIGLTQPAVSQRIGLLEKHLNTQLFLRQARTISLTVDGETWLPYVQAALRGLSESSELLFASGKNRLTISASQSVISLWLLPRLARVHADTGAQISVQSYILGGQTATTDNTIQIRYGSGNWPHHYQIPLFTEALTPVCAPSLLEEAETDDWTSLPRLACTGPRPDWSSFTQRFALPSTPMPQIRIDTMDGTIKAAKAGLGVALGSLPLCLSDLQSGALVRLGEHIFDHSETYWLLATRSAISRRQWESLSSALTSTEI